MPTKPIYHVQGKSALYIFGKVWNVDGHHYEFLLSNNLFISCMCVSVCDCAQNELSLNTCLNVCSFFFWYCGVNIKSTQLSSIPFNQMVNTEPEHNRTKEC